MTERRVAVVVDSGAELDEGSGVGLAVVPLHVMVGDATLDGNANAEVYARLRRGERAHTSTPSPGDYLAAFEGVADGFDAILCLAIPARWSGTHASASVAADMFRLSHRTPVIDVLETPTAATGYALVARMAEAVCAAGWERQAALERVVRAGDEVRMFGALETLEHVARSGRVPALVAGVSDALHVRPVFEMQGGGTGRVGLARTDSGVVRALERAARERLEPSTRHWLMVFHADAPALAAQLREALAGALDPVHLETVELSPTIGVHTGPGAVGFAALPIDDGDPTPPA